MRNESFGKIIKVSGAKATIAVFRVSVINKVSVDNFVLNYVSVGSLLGTKLVDGRTLILTVEEIYDNKGELLITSSICGIYDNVLGKFSFGTNAYPLVGEHVYTLDNGILTKIFAPKKSACIDTIGTYIYDSNVQVGYDPDVLFGKHLGVYGNTGSGKTCTIVSVIQNYIRNNPEKDIKFIILDVNGEYRTSFRDDEADYYTFECLRFHHTSLNNVEYGKLFKASEGIQYPALKDCINNLSGAGTVDWDLNRLTPNLESWIQNNGNDNFSRNQLNGYLRTMMLRIEAIINDEALMTVINASDDEGTFNRINNSNKKVHILDLQVSSDSLDIVLYLLFKTLYQYKSINRNTTHLNLVLEEAHRYINVNVEETKLGNYYIDKLSREGRKFGIGLIISSQVPSMLSYEIVSQCNSVIMHKITSKRDMEFLRGILRVSSDAFFLQMSALEKQHAIVCGEAFPNDSIVKIHCACPLPRSSDPTIEDVLLGANGSNHF
jgi:hypothetical protein